MKKKAHRKIEIVGNKRIMDKEEEIKRSTIDSFGSRKSNLR